MLYNISRTSVYKDETPPHPSAFRYGYNISEKTYYPNNNWHELGNNHRSNNGLYLRDRDLYGWFVELETMGDLLDFVDEVGDVIIIAPDENMPYYHLEIYDDYRE